MAKNPVQQVYVPPFQSSGVGSVTGGGSANIDIGAATGPMSDLMRMWWMGQENKRADERALTRLREEYGLRGAEAEKERQFQKPAQDANIALATAQSEAFKGQALSEAQYRKLLEIQTRIEELKEKSIPKDYFKTLRDNEIADSNSRTKVNVAKADMFVDDMTRLRMYATTGFLNKATKQLAGPFAGKLERAITDWTNGEMQRLNQMSGNVEKMVSRGMSAYQDPNQFGTAVASGLKKILNMDAIVKAGGDMSKLTLADMIHPQAFAAYAALPFVGGANYDTWLALGGSPDEFAKRGQATYQQGRGPVTDQPINIVPEVGYAGLMLNRITAEDAGDETVTAMRDAIASAMERAAGQPQATVRRYGQDVPADNADLKYADTLPLRPGEVSGVVGSPDLMRQLAAKFRATPPGEFRTLLTQGTNTIENRFRSLPQVAGSDTFQTLIDTGNKLIAELPQTAQEYFKNNREAQMSLINIAGNLDLLAKSPGHESDLAFYKAQLRTTPFSFLNDDAARARVLNTPPKDWNTPDISTDPAILDIQNQFKPIVAGAEKKAEQFARNKSNVLLDGWVRRAMAVRNSPDPKKLVPNDYDNRLSQAAAQGKDTLDAAMGMTFQQRGFGGGAPLSEEVKRAGAVRLPKELMPDEGPNPLAPPTGPEAPEFAPQGNPLMEPNKIMPPPRRVGMTGAATTQPTVGGY